MPFLLFLYRRGGLESCSRFVGNSQFLTSFRTTRSQYLAAVGCRHPLTETVLVDSLTLRRLECPFHGIIFLFRLFFDVFSASGTLEKRRIAECKYTMFFFSAKILLKINSLPAFESVNLRIRKNRLYLHSETTGSDGRVARQRSAKPRTAVRIRFGPRLKMPIDLNFKLMGISFLIDLVLAPL